MLFGIKFGKTKQKEVAFVATTFKALLTVAEADVALAGCKLCAGNVYRLFENNFAHIITS